MVRIGVSRSASAGPPGLGERWRLCLGVDTPGWSNSALSGRRPRRSGHRCSSLPDLDTRSAEEILGYDASQVCGSFGDLIKGFSQDVGRRPTPGASEPATGCGPHKQSTLRKTVRGDPNCRLPINERNGRICKVLPDKFELLGKDPLAWLERAEGHRIIADMVRRRLWELTASPEPAHAGRVEELACMRTYMMMMGFAFENLAKAIFITRDHSIVSNANLGTWPMSRGGHGFAKAIKSILSQLSPVRREPTVKAGGIRGVGWSLSNSQKCASVQSC